MRYDAWQSLPQMFFEQAARHVARPYLRDKRDGTWHSRTYGEVASVVSRFASSLIQLGLQPGERVALIAENRPEWTIADLAIMAAGGITVPAFTTNTIADHAHILGNSGAVGAIVSSRTLAERIVQAGLKTGNLRFLIAIEDTGIGQAPPFTLLRWDAALERGKEDDPIVAARMAAIKRTDTACFIYTSGTGGLPKGVMLTHGGILANCKGAYHLLKEFGLGREVFLSFLPLSHSYEHTVGQMFPMTIGAEVWFAEGADKLLENAAEARPTIMTAVPRLYEAMRGRIERQMTKLPDAKRRWFERAVALGRKQYEGERLTLGERVQDCLADILVRRKMKKRFGGRLKAMVSGGAALNYEVGIYFTALGLRILQGYGQTEFAPVVSCNPPHDCRIDTVGKPLVDVELSLGPDGEILVRGEAMMKGYWGDEAATAAALEGGWLHTGDVGEIDKDGYVRITDRKKDIIVLSGGDNISPARVEGMLTLQPEIAQAMVDGDKHPHLVALIVPDETFVAQWASQNGGSRDLAQLAGNAALHQALSPAIDRANAMLSNLEKIRRYVVADEGFTTENGMLTVSMKIRRHKIRERFGAKLAGLYTR
ncbi:MAG: long-chain fatty acid--CoA ligase [Rhodospirillaceae bacterium]|nr:long-chain fatty acid--CoA ligase [Rhodospirillaceae bacterium]